MANEQNLMPIEEVNSRRTREQHSEDSRRAGIKSGEVRRQRKAMKEQLDMLLSLPFKEIEKLDFIENLGIDKDQIDNQMALLVAMYGRALKGDVQAFKEIREVSQDNQTISKDNRVEIINDLPEDEEDEN